MIINPFIEFPTPSGPGNTISLLHMDGSNGGTSFQDDVIINTWAATNAITSTSSPKFGTAFASLTYPPRASIDGQSNIAVGSTDFTIECWVTNSGTLNIIDCLDNSRNLEFTMTSMATNFVYNAAAASWSIASSAIPIDAAWHHIALVKTLTDTFQIFIDGISQGAPSAGSASMTPINQALRIGHSGITNQAMDEFRISNIARYSTNFTPPAAPFILD